MFCILFTNLQLNYKIPYYNMGYLLCQCGCKCLSLDNTEGCECVTNKSHCTTFTCLCNGRTKYNKVMDIENIITGHFFGYQWNIHKYQLTYDFGNSSFDCLVQYDTNANANFSAESIMSVFNTIDNYPLSLLRFQTMPPKRICAYLWSYSFESFSDMHFRLQLLSINLDTIMNGHKYTCVSCSCNYNLIKYSDNIFVCTNNTNCMKYLANIVEIYYNVKLPVLFNHN